MSNYIRSFISVLKRGWLVDIEGYSKKLTGLSTFTYNFGSSSLEDYDEGEEYIYGVDVLVRKRFRRFRSWISYSYSKSMSYFEDISDTRFPSNLDQPHKLTFSQSYSTEQFELSLGWTVKSGIPYTSPVSDVAERVVRVIGADDNDGDVEEEEFFEIQYDGINNNRLPMYNRLDASIWYFFSGGKNTRFQGKIGVSILNILDHQNIQQRSFFVDQDPNDTDAEETDLFSEERYLLGLTPNLTISLKF